MLPLSPFFFCVINLVSYRLSFTFYHSFAYSLHPKYSTMDLVFIAELDGFQHGPGPFHLKRIILFPIQGGSPATYTFMTDFLFDDPDHAQTTDRYATRHLHGLPMALPGIPYENWTDVLTAYFKTRAYHFLGHTGDSTGTAPRILLLVKGQQKGDLLQSVTPRKNSHQSRNPRPRGLWLPKSTHARELPLIYWGPCGHFCSLASRTIHRFTTFTLDNSTGTILIHQHTQGIDSVRTIIEVSLHFFFSKTPVICCVYSGHSLIYTVYRSVVHSWSLCVSHAWLYDLAFLIVVSFSCNFFENQEVFIFKVGGVTIEKGTHC